MYKIVILSIFLSITACNFENNSKTIEQEDIAVVINYDQVDELPIAVLYNTNMELDFIQVANANQTEFKISEVVITSNRWNTTFNEAGNITAQSRTASIVAYKDNKCYIQNLVFEQKLEGKVFGETKIASKDNWKIFNCDLQKNNNPNAIAGVTIVKN